MSGQYYIGGPYANPALFDYGRNAIGGYPTKVAAWEAHIEQLQRQREQLGDCIDAAFRERDKAKTEPKVYYVLRRKSTGLFAAKTGSGKDGWTDDVFAAKLYSAKGVENRGIEYLKVNVELKA